MENKKSILCFISGIVLFGVSMYLVYYITTIVDFNVTTVIINNDQNLWKFLSFLPVLVTMFTGALLIVNAIFNVKALHILGMVLAIGLVVFFKYDLYGFVTIIPAYKTAIDYLIIILIVVSVILLLDLIIQLIKKPRHRREVNLEA